MLFNILSGCLLIFEITILGSDSHSIFYIQNEE